MQRGSDPRPCPLCERPLYGWIALAHEGAGASIGMPLAGDGARERVIDRCEHCGVAVAHDDEIDLAAEWAAVRATAAGDDTISIPNRASLQAAIGVEGWAAIELAPGRLLHTPRSLELLAEANGRRLERLRTPLARRAQAWMWQTLLNGLTFHPNFAREVRAGRLRPASARGRFAFAADCVVTALAAPLVLLASAPLELIAALARRGGELQAAPVAVGSES